MSPPTPAKYIQICLPKEGKKKKDGENNTMTIMLLDRCGFNPERKTFVLSTCYVIRFLSCSLFLSLLHSGLSSKEKARSKLCVLRSEAALTLGPSATRGSLQTWEKSARENRGELEPARVRESASPGAPAAEGRPRPPLTHSVWSGSRSP